MRFPPERVYVVVLAVAVAALALAALEDHPEPEAVRANVGAARQATSYRDRRRRQERGLSAERTRMRTPDGTR